MKKKTLSEWEQVIDDNVDYVDIKPYSHNIICIALNGIAGRFGIDKANEMIDKYGLEELGWVKQNPKKHDRTKRL